MSPRLVIGIAGGSGSGKTTIVERLLRGPFSDHVSLLSLDSYYLDAAQVPTIEGSGQNWDHPQALDDAMYLAHISQLLNGEPVEQPVYDFAHDCRTIRTIEVLPRTILLLEGILLFAIPSIVETIDLRVFVDTPVDIRLIRRTVRDIEQRGRTIRSVAKQYEQTVRPMHEQFVEATKFSAHIVIPWLNDNDGAIELLRSRIGAAVRADEAAQDSAAIVADRQVRVQLPGSRDADEPTFL